jgi:hypothetical protein
MPKSSEDRSPDYPPAGPDNESQEVPNASDDDVALPSDMKES